MTKALHTIGKLQTRDEVGRAHAMEAAAGGRFSRRWCRWRARSFR
jgi:hypothetical protein